MKQFYMLVAGLSLIFFWFMPKENNDSSAALSYSKKNKPTPTKLNVRVVNRSSLAKANLSVSDNQVWQSPLAANITVVKNVAVEGGGNAILGGQLNYSIVVSNTASGVANNAAEVAFNDILNENLTLAAGSVKATPIGVNDTYDVIGNVGITVPVGIGVLANDISPDATALTVSISTTSPNGTLSLSANGSFTYLPNPGYSGTDSFIYTLTSSNGTTSTNNTVTLAVSAPIWFVNIAATSNGTGTLASPFKNWSDFASSNVLTAAANPAANQTIFVYSGSYSGAAILKAGQKVLGQGATVTLGSFVGATIQSYTNTLPSTGLTRPILTSSNTCVTLASGNTLRGFDMGNSVKDIVGSNFDTLTISEIELNGNGATLDLNTGTLAANFTNISSTNSASDAISLNNISGTLTNTGTTTITNPSGKGINIVGNTSLNSSFGNTAVTGSGQSGLLVSSSNNSISTTFGSLDIAPDAGQSTIQLSGNAGTFSCTSGALTSTNSAFNVNISGAGPSLKLTLNMSLTSVSASVGNKGIYIKDASGSFTVTGVGTTTGSGGTLTNLTQKGLELVNASNITLKNMNLTNANTTDEVLSDTDYSVSNGGIVANGVIGLIINNVSITGSVQRGIAGHNVSNFSMTNCTVNNSGNNVNEGALAFTNLSGTALITGSTITRANEHLISIHNTNVNLNLTVSNSNISDTQTTPSGTASAVVGTGILINTFGSGKTYVSVSNCTLNKIGADGIKLINNNTSTGSYEITGSTIDPVNTVTQPNDVGTAIEITSNGTSTIYTNIHDNTRFSANGGNVITIAPTENSTIHAKVTNNIVTYKSGGISGIFRGIEIFGQNDAKGYVTITGNTVTGLPESNGIMVDNRTVAGNAGIGRIDANISNNTITLNYPDPSSTGRCIVLEAGNSTTLPANTICARVSANSTTTNGLNGNFRVSSYASGSTLLEGSTDAATAWNLNGNTPGVGANVVSVRSNSIVTMVAANTCVAPLNPPAFVALLADNVLYAESKNEPNRLTTEAGKPKENIVTSEVLSLVNPEPIIENLEEPASEETQNAVANINAGETVTVNGTGGGFLLPAGKSTTITFSAIISTSPTSCAISNQASVTASGIAAVISNITTTNIIIPPPTGITSATPICVGQPILLSATCVSGAVQWYTLAAPSTLIGTSVSGATFSQSPIVNTTYQAACKVNGCESARTNSGLITANPLPTITVNASPAICEGVMSFTIPYSNTTQSPTTYSITGTGIATVTNASLPTTPIVVNLSNAASGSSYSYELSVSNANGCVSSGITGNVSVSPVPTITTGPSPAICSGANSFTIPFTSTTGAPTTYSILGTGITTVTNGTLTTSPIIVNLSAGASGSSISYTISVRNAGGCTSSDVNGSVSVNPLPIITLGSISAICAGATTFSIPYTATTESPITYFISGIRIPTVTNAPLPSSPIIVNVTDTQSGEPQFTQFTVTNANGCTSSNISRTVTVNPLPVFNVGASPAICEGASSFTVPNISSSSGIVSYSFSGSGITTITDAPFTPRPQFIVGISDAGGATGSSYSYIFTVKNSNGCTSNNTTGSVTVNSTPASTNPMATPSNFTTSGTTTLTASGCSSPSTISWYDSSNPSVALPNNTPTISSNKTFFARCTGTNTCVSEPSANVNVTYNPCTPLVSSPGNVGINWTGLISTDWNNPCNWNPAWVPDATNSAVVIDLKTNQPTISSTVPSVKLIYVNSNATLTVASGGTLNASSTAAVLTLQGGNIINDGTINLSGSGIGISIGATANITNRGTITTNNLYGIALGFGNLTFLNESTGIVNGDFKANNNILTLTNSGTINYAGGTYALSLGSSGSSVVNTGTISVAGGSGISNPSGSTIDNNACGKILMTAGGYENDGTTTNFGLIQMPNLFDFTNTGVFANPGFLKANSVSSVSNSSIIITNSCPIFTIGRSPRTINGIFTDNIATNSAGTYTSVGNKFTANNTIPTGTQTLYAQVTNGTCTFVVPFDFNNIKPTAVLISATNICVGSSITLSAVCASGTVTWYSSSEGSSPLGIGSTFDYLPAVGNNLSYYAACENDNCKSGRTITSNNVIVNPKPEVPTVAVTGLSNVCFPSILTLSASGCSDGIITWSEGSVTSSSLVLSAVGNYSVSATCTINGCISNASVAVTGLEIKAKPAAPTITAPASLSACFPSTLTLNANGSTGGTITWSEGSVTGSSLVLSTIGTYSISATCTINGCISDQSTVISGLEIKSTPDIPLDVNVSKTTICSNSSITLSANCSGIANFFLMQYDDGTIKSSIKQSIALNSASVIWYTQQTGGSPIGTGNVLVNTPIANTIYYASCVENGCESIRVATSQVNVVSEFPNPTGVAVNYTALCNSGSVILTANCEVGSIKWYTNSSGGVEIGTGNLLSQTINSTTTYYASCEGDNCVSTRIATNQVVVTNTTLTCNTPVITEATSNCGAIVNYNPPAVVSCNQSDEQTNTYNFTGSAVDWTVPSGVTSINIKAWGAQGGANWVNNTNFGGFSEGTLTVMPGEVLKIYVGEHPTTTSGGWNGGGAGDGAGKGGGGASDIRQGGISLSDRKIIASGGGGAGYWSNLHVFGGVGGGLIGGDGYRNTTSDAGGKGATQSNGGDVGTCVNFNSPLMAGSLGQGGSPLGFNCGCEGYGGGGGYYGGAGSGNCRGGGGGSGYIGGVSSGNMIAGVQIGNGKIEISYQASLEPTVTQTAGLVSGSVFPIGITTNTFEVNDNGYITTCSFDVTVNAVATSISYNGTEFCKTTAPSSLLPTIIGLTGGTFSSTPLGLSINVTSGAVDLMSSDAGTYLISYSFDGCNIPTSTTITLKAKPAAPSITTPTNLIVCSPSTLTLNASGCADGTITWSQSAATGTSLTISDVGTYSISATCTVNGCTSDASTAVTGLEIKAKPAAPTITTPASVVVCSPSTLTHNASGCADGTITWSEGAATGTSLTISDVGTYSISATCTVNGCTSDASTAVTGLEIKAKPDAPTITTPASLVVCSPSTLTLTASGCAGGTITWSQSSSTGTSLTISDVGTYSISATCTINGCTSDASTVVTGLEIKVLPTSSPSSNSPICAGGTLNLSGLGGETYLWSGPNNFTSEDQNPSILDVGEDYAGIYTLTVTTNGCSQTALTTVVINTISIPAPSGNMNLSCDVLSVSRTASGGLNYAWSGLLGTNAVANISESGTYTVTVTDANGCSATTSTTVTFASNLLINQHPQNIGICVGNNAAFSVAANLQSTTYQWEVDAGSGFEPIMANSVYSGQNTATLSLAFPTLTYNNYKYRCQITLNSCTLTSELATLSMSGSAEALNIVNVTPISGVYSQTAVAYTIALNKIEPNANVVFKSGNAIVLLPGFETRAGAVFTTKIESPCGLNTTNNSIFENLPKEIRK